jgi:hypothetical protein
LDSEDDTIGKSVEANGWHCISVDADEDSPGFQYTVGLTSKWSHPDAIVFGLSAQQGYSLLNSLVSDVRGGKSYAQNGLYDGLFENVKVAVRRVHPNQHEMYFGYAMGHCRLVGRAGSLEAIQLLWPDKAGRFSFESGCDSATTHAQPSLYLAATPSELKSFRRSIGTL